MTIILNSYLEDFAGRILNVSPCFCIICRWDLYHSQGVCYRFRPWGLLVFGPLLKNNSLFHLSPCVKSHTNPTYPISFSFRNGSPPRWFQIRYERASNISIRFDSIRVGCLSQRSSSYNSNASSAVQSQGILYTPPGKARSHFETVFRHSTKEKVFDNGRA